MRSLSTRDVTRLSEWGEDKHPIDRALALARLAAPNLEREELIGLPIGRLNLLLLALRESTFGPEFEIRLGCPDCTEQLEMNLPAAAFRMESRQDEVRDTLELEDLQIVFRAPTSADLAAVTPLGDQASAALLQRVVLSVTSRGERLAPTALGDPVLEMLMEAIDRLDPAAHVQIPFRCPSCDCESSAVFDIASFMWEEITAYTRRLEVQVDRIARAYGWTEAVILGMSEGRRARYMELCARG